MENVIIWFLLTISTLLFFRLKPYKETKAILKDDYVPPLGDCINKGTVVRVKGYINYDGITYAICTYSDKMVNIPIHKLKEYHL